MSERDDEVERLVKEYSPYGPDSCLAVYMRNAIHAGMKLGARQENEAIEELMVSLCFPRDAMILDAIRDRRRP